MGIPTTLDQLWEYHGDSIRSKRKETDLLSCRSGMLMQLRSELGPSHQVVSLFRDVGIPSSKQRSNRKILVYFMHEQPSYVDVDGKTKATIDILSVETSESEAAEFLRTHRLP